jgi:hypothetical protein
MKCSDGYNILERDYQTLEKVPYPEQNMGMTSAIVYPKK